MHRCGARNPSASAALGALSTMANSLPAVGGRGYGGLCLSGCWRHIHVEGEGFSVSVVVMEIALEGERDG
jgi:hypothetical protein